MPQLWDALRHPEGRVCTRPRDIPYGTRVLRLIWHKRRWRYKERLCPRASFTESLPAVRARSRLTTRLRTELGYAVAEQGRVVSRERDRTAGSDSVNEARGHSCSLQRQRRLCQISRNTLVP